eukprot:TRINITY_DN12233_c0_g1_i1.p1 TRINITY_DN12233_c0_g1~~TRINITY_DN12233_c0_g1_i1.p1  ORF type:complete len:529 (+),score=89.79 TRINITY_DN12233_c0_g1_i1:57-1643(+)
MGSSSTSAISLLFLLFLLIPSSATSSSTHEDFLHCLSKSTTPKLIIYTPNTPSYYHFLQSSIQNDVFLSPTTPKPLFITVPKYKSQIQASVICCRNHSLQLRIRSGGHDYEGLSYLSNTPFMLLDLINFQSISVNIDDQTARVQSGATIGDLYYKIAKKSNTLGFPAGICPTVGVGGHFSGGGFGALVRKYGLAADNVIDAYVIDVNGRILDRESMGEDLFWAIRGGGGASFGVILSWKIKLVHVPPTVTVFTIHKTLKQGATKLVDRWQYIGNKLHEDLFIRIIVQIVEGDGKGERTIQASFNSMFLGGVEDLLPLMEKSFPELGLEAKDSVEMSWIQSVLYFAGYQNGEPLDVLRSRIPLYKSAFKAKSDFVVEPIPESVFEGVWERFLEEGEVYIVMDPFGARMSEISESQTPFPHREGTLYNIQYIVKWITGGIKEPKKHKAWIRRLYRYMGPYVSKNPRAAYLNYRDLDLGSNQKNNTSYSVAKVWGQKYFKNNFRRLALVKGEVDPDNFFRNEQSIPPLIKW